MPDTKIKSRSVLFVGQAFYNHWYLSRELRKLGWKADQLDMASTLNSDFFHGQDLSFADTKYNTPQKQLRFYLDSLCIYDIFHFANAHGIYFITTYDSLKDKPKGVLYKPTHTFFIFFFSKILRWNLSYIYRLATFLGTNRVNKLMLKYGHHLPERWDVLLIKKLGKKIVYTNNGCLDGVLKSSFAKWSTPDNSPICSTICHYKDREDICSDAINGRWGQFRNEVSDYQCLLGGNRADFNISEKVHERPEVYCLDKNFWSPDILIPTNYLLAIPPTTVKLFHSVGNFENRNQNGSKTIKSTHIYFEVVEKLKAKGLAVELIFFKDVPNKIIRYYQAQADIFVDMLSFGFFGANIREGMMLGKACVCNLRPEWMEQMRKEIPEYANELPVINATPQTVEAVLTDLINNPQKRKEIGERSRKFAEKWHSSDSAAKKFDEIYSKLLTQR
jgi:glycosyltransferase involved in cell wall biosynthesis